MEKKNIKENIKDIEKEYTKIIIVGEKSLGKFCKHFYNFKTLRL